jgi:hypothetical protein
VAWFFHIVERDDRQWACRHGAHQYDAHLELHDALEHTTAIASDHPPAEVFPHRLGQPTETVTVLPSPRTSRPTSSPSHSSPWTYSQATTRESVVTVPKPVAGLLTARRLEQVPADRPSAELRLSRAEEKLGAARKVAAIDVEVAYLTAYDAVRIAITAHMLSLSYRVRAVAAAHEAVGIYAEATITSPSTGGYCAAL